MIQLQHITKSYNHHVVIQDLSLEIKNGELLVIVGQSGSGKTTLLNIINGLITPENGEIFYNQQRLTNEGAEQLRLKSGYVLQSSSLFPHLTVLENFFVQPKARHEKWTKEEQIEKGKALCQQVQLDTSCLMQYPKELSGGQQQRVSIARALANQPQFILLDEPFSALDPFIRKQLQELLLELHKNHPEITFVMVTHDMEEALKLGDRIAVLHEGNLEQVDSPQAVIYQPKTPFVEELFAGKNLDVLWFRTFLTVAFEVPIEKEMPVIQNFSELLELAKVRDDYPILFQTNHRGYQTTFSTILRFISKELRQW